MIRLVIIADDLTGALDTGIKFAKMGIRAQVVTIHELTADKLDESKELLVIDTETRHVSINEAYARVYKAAKLCESRKVEYFYKKTDSALRGHIGSELAALYDVLEEPVAFIPALPEEHRITQQGVHYIDGVPVSQSIFGKDSLNPVRHSRVEELIHEETRLKVENVYNVDQSSGEDGQVTVYDASSREDFVAIADHLQEGGSLRVTAGCAGFAEVLASRIPFHRDEVYNPPRTEKLFVLCGSINEVTGRQIVYAQSQGYKRIALTQEQKLKPDYYLTESGKRFLYDLKQICEEHSEVIVDVFSGQALEETRSYAAGCGIGCDEIPERISGCLAEIGRHIVSFAEDATLLVIGGDTLYAFVQTLKEPILDPVCEPVCGTVSMNVETEGHIFPLISKSGGFGQENLIIEVAKHVMNHKEGI